MLRWRRPTSAEIAALVTVAAVAIVMSVNGGTMFSPGALNAQSRGTAALGGVHTHAEIGGNCAACHAPTWSGDTMASRCLNCHADVRNQLDTRGPLHGMLADGTQCRTCHTEHRGAHGGLTSFERFDHDCAAFKLTGKHLSIECQCCHVNQAYKGTAQTCVSCHVEPAVHKGRFGTNCASCHSTTTWQQAPDSMLTAKFNHDLTGFKLTGRHSAAECKACHVNNIFKGTSQACVSCHADPVVHKGRFGTNCASCHSTTTWKQGPDSLLTAKFDHNLAAFKLTGKHMAVECKACHVNNTFKGTAQDCLSCHVEPKVHKGKFGTNCASCHSTTTWEGAKFTHKFPLNHGKRNQAIECATCHTTANNYKAYTCYGCHQHEPTRIARKHSKIANFQDCARCHPTGRENERRGSLDVPRPDVLLGKSQEENCTFLAIGDRPKGCPGFGATDLGALFEGRKGTNTFPAIGDRLLRLPGLATELGGGQAQSLPGDLAAWNLLGPWRIAPGPAHVWPARRE